jgi:hypothetical protein
MVNKVNVGEFLIYTIRTKMLQQDEQHQMDTSWNVWLKLDTNTHNYKQVINISKHQENTFVQKKYIEPVLQPVDFIHHELCG